MLVIISFVLIVLVPDIADCPTSRRSGRHIIPPLAWWTTERILIDPYTKCPQIVCDSPVVAPRDLASKTSNSRTDGRQKNKRLGTRVKHEPLSELSTSVVENGTNSLVCII